MLTKKIGYVIANFGGPRNLGEVEPFLISLLTDQDVVRTTLPSFVHRYLFTRVAKKRTVKISSDYAEIGGKSPIYDDTEAVVESMKQVLDGPVISFHRYLPVTHPSFIETIVKMECDEIRVFPMFPQFTYATTGSIARWFGKNLPTFLLNKIRWVKSYPAHPSFIEAHQKSIRTFLEQRHLKEEETILLFSAHGVPQAFIDTGDLYQSECQASYRSVMEAFPKILGRLSYQSRFGPEEWLKPYTIDVCNEINAWNQGRKEIVFVPISFTSDHIETLFEIEKDYMTVIREQGLNAYRVEGLNLNPDWLQAISKILLQESNFSSNQMLIRSRS